MTHLNEDPITHDHSVCMQNPNSPLRFFYLVNVIRRPTRTTNWITSLSITSSPCYLCTYNAQGHALPGITGLIRWVLPWQYTVHVSEIYLLRSLLTDSRFLLRRRYLKKQPKDCSQEHRDTRWAFKNFKSWAENRTKVVPDDLVPEDLLQCHNHAKACKYLRLFVLETR